MPFPKIFSDPGSTWFLPLTPNSNFWCTFWSYFLELIKPYLSEWASKLGSRDKKIFVENVGPQYRAEIRLNTCSRIKIIKITFFQANFWRNKARLLNFCFLFVRRRLSPPNHFESPLAQCSPQYISLFFNICLKYYTEALYQQFFSVFYYIIFCRILFVQ